MNRQQRRAHLQSPEAIQFAAQKAADKQARKEQAELAAQTASNSNNLINSKEISEIMARLDALAGNVQLDKDIVVKGEAKFFFAPKGSLGILEKREGVGYYGRPYISYYVEIPQKYGGESFPLLLIEIHELPENASEFDKYIHGQVCNDANQNVSLYHWSSGWFSSTHQKATKEFNDQLHDAEWKRYWEELR